MTDPTFRGRRARNMAELESALGTLSSILSERPESQLPVV